LPAAMLNNIAKASATYCFAANATFQFLSTITYSNCPAEHNWRLACLVSASRRNDLWRKVRDREDAIANTRNACATRSNMRCTYQICAMHEIWNIDLQVCAPSGVSLRFHANEERTECPLGAQAAGLCSVPAAEKNRLAACAPQISFGVRVRRVRKFFAQAP
jgi:hypothetical protein